jgi:membrane dipeptidase
MTVSPFCMDVFRELNRLGVMVDVSHVGNDMFYDALEVSVTPTSHRVRPAVFE